MLTEEQLQDAVKCDGNRARCEECGLLNYMGQDDCVRRLAETAIELKAELETEKALHYKYEKLALKNAMGYDEVKAERDAMRKDLEENPVCQTCIREETCESSNSLGCGTGEWKWRGPIESKGVTVL